MTGQHSGHGHVRGNREYWSNDRTVMYGNNVDFAWWVRNLTTRSTRYCPRC